MIDGESSLSKMGQFFPIYHQNPDALDANILGTPRPPIEKFVHLSCLT
jgi:hypothetical protein